jgi:Uncharacterised nucleotidyltransferase
VNHGSAPAKLIEAISDPARLRELDAKAWEGLLSCARRNGVLAYLASRVETRGVMEDLPPFARDALLSARLSAARLGQLALWELDRVVRVLRPAGIDVVALKGVAYLLRGLRHASTRRMSDIDFMVRRESLAGAEQALRTAGWSFANPDPYDEQYYRTWSHELPPLQFPGRMLAVDVHHTICPPASRLRPDPAAMWARAEPAAKEGVYLLCPEDSVLHAAVHLFFDSDFDSRFRELVDLHELVMGFAERDGFWRRLIERARELGLTRPLYYAMRGLVDVIATPVPVEVLDETSSYGPPAPVAAWMRETLATVLSPVDPEPWPPRHAVKLWLLYVRSHWLRMPAHALIPHLARKAMRRTTTTAP